MLILEKYYANKDELRHAVSGGGCDESLNVTFMPDGHDPCGLYLKFRFLTPEVAREWLRLVTLHVDGLCGMIERRRETTGE